MAQAFQDLLVWQRSMEMTVQIYELTQGFPREEIYGLTSQLRRASVSVASNIAEGRGRISQGEFKQFLGHARGSLYELETQMHLAISFGYLNNEVTGDLMASCDEVGRLLNGLLVALK